MKFTKVAKKYFEYGITKIEILWAQHTFRSDDTRVNYIFKKNAASKDLIVIFSACTRKGLKARYNYLKSLQGINANRLYILDDYADDHRGAYYLGENMQFNEENATRALIDEIKNQIDAKKVLYCGSSKGGYAALNFGIEQEDSYIVVGAPQYFLATYLKKSDNLDAYRHIVGTDKINDDDNDRILDQRLQAKIAANSEKKNPHIFIHYSDKEHTYEEHIKDLLSDLKQNGYDLTQDVADYQNHSDISYYFPDFLRKSIQQILKDDTTEK